MAGADRNVYVLSKTCRNEERTIKKTYYQCCNNLTCGAYFYLIEI